MIFSYHIISYSIPPLPSDASSSGRRGPQHTHLYSVLEEETALTVSQGGPVSETRLGTRNKYEHNYILIEALESKFHLHWH